MTADDGHLAVEVQFAEGLDVTGVPDSAFFEAWAEVALQGQSASCTVRIVDADEITALNAQFRDKSTPTNVLAFESGLPPELAEGYLGDIVVCVPVVQREAREQGKACDDHYAHMVVHGILHLRGYDHIEPSDAIRMEKLETQLLVERGLPDPYLQSSGDRPSSHG